MFIGVLYTIVSPRRRLGKRTQTVLQECTAIFRLFTADAASQAGSRTKTVPLSSDLVSGTAEVKGNHMGLAYTNTYCTTLDYYCTIFCTYILRGQSAAMYSFLRLP